jgi:hypothetical protein
VVAGVTGSAWLLGARTVAASAVAAAWAVAVLGRALLPRTGALPALGATSRRGHRHRAQAASTRRVSGGRPPAALSVLAGLVATVGTAQPPRVMERVDRAGRALSLSAVPGARHARLGAGHARQHRRLPHADIVTLRCSRSAVAGRGDARWRRDARPWWALLVLLTACPRRARS